MSDKHSRTERASAHKRKKTREKGQVFRSREVSGAMSFVAAVTGVVWLGGAVEDGLTKVMVFFFTSSATTDAPAGELVRAALYRGSFVGVPFMALALVASLGGTIAQSLPVVTFEPLKPDVKRLFSLSKLTNMFSFSGAANLVRGVFGLFALTLAGVTVIAPEIGRLTTLPDLEPVALGAFIAGLVSRLFVRAAFVFAIIAVLDYVLNHRQHEEQLKMTKHELKEEHKQHEGDPKIKARIKKLQRAAARNRMMTMVETATVVITNPTHVAVALVYDAETAPAPRVVAKGKGELAERIRTIARKHEVVIYEDPPLARALYSVELGAVIPSELFKAVAEVLAHLVRISALRV